MQRRKFTTAALCGLGLGAGVGLPGVAWAAINLSETDAAVGVRAALERGAIAAVELLGRNDGFFGNPKVRIPLPGFLDSAGSWLKVTGQRKRVEALELAMNRAAEAAVPEARSLLVSTVKNLSVDDAVRLVSASGETAVTEFFANKTRTPLAERFLPIVTRATEKVALVERYNAVAGRAASIGMLKARDANIQQYVTEKALDGLFLMIGDEERKIRANPVATGSDILRKVFSRN